MHEILLYWSVDTIFIVELHHDRWFVLFVEGFGVVGEDVYFVDDFEIVTTIFNLGLEWYHVIFGIFLYENKDGEHTVYFRSMRVNLINMSEVWISS